MKSKIVNQTSPARPDAWLLGVRGLTVAALGISTYLLWGSLTGDRLPGCGPASGCREVMHSRWAYWFGLPVSLPALLLYATVLSATAVLGRTTPLEFRRRVWGFLIAAATAVMAAAAWFIGLQLFVIQAICPFCMAAHTCGLLLGSLILLKARGSRLAPHADKLAGKPGSLVAKSPASPAPPATSLLIPSARPFVLAGLAAVGVLGAGQLIHQPKTFEVQSLAASVSPQKSLLATNPTAVRTVDLAHEIPTRAFSNSVATTGASSVISGSPAAQSTNPSPAEGVRSEIQPLASAPVGGKTGRLLRLHGDAFALDLDHVPLLGSPEAPCVIVHLFDYSCRHCRELHPKLVEAYHNLSNQLAIVGLPVPLATNCNRLVRVPIADHTNACAYARAGLAVWRADPTKLSTFDDWIFAPARPPAPAAVETEARRLVGVEAFNRALADPWINQQLDLSIRIYATNYLRYRRGQLPQIVIGTNLVSGTLRNVGDLYQLLSNQFKLRLPEVP